MVKLNLGANVDTGECYAIGPNAKEVFKIVKAYEFGHSDVKLSLLKDKWDEDDKENGNKKKQGSKAIQRDGRRPLDVVKLFGFFHYDSLM
ncbi:hypothetical protein CAEBREN_10275 [Caenorhabditis brenneri]|nr:hypothetical protein CAEBREN_10275 [Caenorhabditis brenneri]